MSWVIHYELPFAAKDGTQYAVRIHEQDYSGSVVRLTGSAEPFVTQEADEENPFEPLRGQTGTIGIVADISTVMALVPNNNTEKMVTLHSGTWNGTTFTATATEWQGFLCGEAYTQPLDGQVAVVQIPVKSMLQCAEDINVDLSLFSGHGRIAKIIADYAGATDVYPWDNVVVISDMDFATNMWGYMRVISSVWFESKEVQEEGDSYDKVSGLTYAEVLGDIARLFGMVFREKGRTLYCCQYDNGTDLRMATYTWAKWSQIANGGTYTPTPTSLTDQVLMDVATWRGADNTVTFNQGRREVSVVLSLDNDTDPMLELPITTEDDSGVETMNIIDGTLKIQPHAPRVNDAESFTFVQIDGSTKEYTAADTYAECLANSFIYRPYYFPYDSAGVLHTGCFPVRWAYQPEQQHQTSLANGLWMVQQFEARASQDTITPQLMYSLQSSHSFYFDSGYLDITGTIYSLYVKGTSGQTSSDVALLQSANYDNVNAWATGLMVALQIGTKAWNGSSWVEMGVSNIRQFAFYLPFDGPSVASNVTDEMPVRDAAGYLIPVNGESGVVKIYVFNICNVWRAGQGTGRIYNHLIKDFKIMHRPVSSITNSDRGENVYTEDISQKGFSADEKVELNIGTYNNNSGSPRFIRDDSMDYVEKLTYVSGTTTATQRPEKHLLCRLAAYYNQTRRVMVTQLATGLDLMGTRYTYAGRTFAGFIKEQNWRNNEQTVQFIEVT